jgi:hypothetical protein
MVQQKIGMQAPQTSKDTKMVSIKKQSCKNDCFNILTLQYVDETNIKGRRTATTGPHLSRARLLILGGHRWSGGLFYFVKHYKCTAK